MFEGLAKLFHGHEDSLDALQKPARLKLRARVSSSNDVRSPFSGSSAAFFLIQFKVEQPSPNDRPGVIYVPVGSAAWGDELRIEQGGNEALLPKGRFTVEFEGALGHGVSLDQALPPSFEWIARSPLLQTGTLFYDELSLSKGEEVTVVAHFERRAQGAGYRDASAGEGTPFVARPDLGPVAVRYRMPSF